MNQPRSKFLIMIIVGLLVANLVMLSILIYNGKPEEKKRPENNRVREYLQREVGFSDQQLSEYEKLGRKHKETLKQLSRQQAGSRNQTLLLLPNQEFSDSAISGAAASLNAQQLAFHVNMLKHLKDIRDLCSPSQRGVFDTGFYKMIGRQNEGRKEK